MKTVSVVVATYRRDGDLTKALDSLAHQSYSNIEIVLVDDNGNAEWNTKVAAIVDNFKNKFPEISLKYIVNNPNQGSAITRNIGIKAAKGEYITFLDDDNVYLPDKIKKQLAFMESGEYDYSITDLVLYNENDKEIDRRIRSYIKDTSVSSLRIYHLKYHMTGTDTMMFKKEYLTKIGRFAPIDVGDEFYLILRAIEGNGKFGYLPGCEIKAYVHTKEGGLSSGVEKIKGEKRLFEYKKKYFEILNHSQKRYIRFRQGAVMVVAYKRNKMYYMMPIAALCAFISSPINFIREVASYIKNIKEVR